MQDSIDIEDVDPADFYEEPDPDNKTVPTALHPFILPEIIRLVWGFYFAFSAASLEGPIPSA